MVLGSLLTRGWPAGELRQLLAQLEPTDFAYGPARRLLVASQENAEAVRQALLALGCQISDGQKCLESVVCKIREDGDRTRRREWADRLAIVARLDPVEYERMLAAEAAKRETPSIAGKIKAG